MSNFVLHAAASGLGMSCIRRLLGGVIYPLSTYDISIVLLCVGMELYVAFKPSIGL
jgi:hypothetical protein